MRKKWKYLLLAVPLAAIALFWIQRAGENVVTVTRGPVVEAVYGIGTVTPTRNYQLKLGITATLAKIYGREGDTVKAGDPLVELDSGTRFSAPFAGTITSLPFKIGESIFPQSPILTLTDLTDRYVVVSLEQQGALRVLRGQKVKLSFESLRGQKLTGTVRSLFPNNGEFFVHIDVDRLPPEILPGMTADVAIEVGRKDNVLLVPVSAISSGQLIVQRAGRKKKVPIQIGIVDGRMAEVVSGDINDGDRVVARVR
jgi:multidrug efflux pump subunit AcrA (membrane-fusion protein)